MTGPDSFDGWTDGDLAAERERLYLVMEEIRLRHFDEEWPHKSRRVTVEDEIERRRVETERATAAAIVEAEDARGRALWENLSDHHLAPDELAFMSESPDGPWWIHEAGRWSRRNEQPECLRVAV